MSRLSVSRLSVLALAALLLLAARAGAREVVDERARHEALEHYRLGEESMRAERWDEAEAEFKQAIRLDPLLAPAHYELGQAHMAMKEYPDAVRAFLGARDAHEKVAALRAGDLAGADRHRQDEIRALHDSINSLRRIGKETVPGQNEHKILQLEARIEGLEKERGLPVGQTAVPPEFVLALGSAYFRAGALPDAEKAWREAIRLRGRFGEAHNNMAVLLMLTGRYPEARKEVLEAEKAGYRVSPEFQKELESRSQGQ